MQVQFISPGPQDVQTFLEISQKTFRDTFAQSNDPAEFEKYMASTFTIEQLSPLLTDPSYHVWFLYQDANMAGYFTLHDQTCPYDVIQGQHPVKLDRFYLDEAYHGTGSAQQMMTFCLAQAKLLGADVIWLGVWEQNAKAIRFYEKHGFQIAGQYDFWIGNDRQNDYLMQKSLNPA